MWIILRSIGFIIFSKAYRNAIRIVKEEVNRVEKETSNMTAEELLNYNKKEVVFDTVVKRLAELGFITIKESAEEIFVTYLGVNTQTLNLLIEFFAFKTPSSKFPEIK